MEPQTDPTGGELEILKVLWDRGEATVREVYEELRAKRPVAQNTVQAFLRTMETKGQVLHRTEGRTFVYRPRLERDQTTSRLLGSLLDRAFDGALDQLVESALALRDPTADEIRRLKSLIRSLSSSSTQ